MLKAYLEGAEMATEINDMSELAYEGSNVPLTTTPVATWTPATCRR